ncbi:MAG TPA: alkaline phosphatase family protein [Candidatus Tumulicola sp.]
MFGRSIAAAILAAVFLGASPAHPLIVYSAPAGVRPAGPDSIHPVQGVLPNGRLVAPSGTTIPVGANPAMLALTPNGRFAIVSNNDDRAGGAPSQASPLAAGASLAVVDAISMRVKSLYQDPGMSFSGGVAALNDPAQPGRTLVLASDGPHGVVLVFDLDSTGTLTPETQRVTLPPQAFPSGIAVTPNGRTAYVADSRGNAVYSVDVAQRRVTATLAAGYGTQHVAVAGGHVVATSGSAAAFEPVASPAPRPPFGAPAFDADRSMVSSVFVTGADGTLGSNPYRVHMDQQPDGSQVIGGDAPGAVVISRDGSTGYVALSNVDRVAVLALNGEPHVVRGLDLRLFPDAPYGAQPSALALSRDGKRLFVALAGLDSVAVLDARSPSRYRYGLVPTGWFPTALAVSPNGRYLYVVGAKGVDGWGVLSRVDLKHTSLIRATMNTLRYTRVAGVAHFNAVVPPLRSARRSDTIQHVVYVGVDPQTYDGAFGADATADPNLHALATAYASADNFYAADRDRDVARAYSYSGSATLATELAAPIGLSKVPPGAGADDPDGYPRFGSLFDALARAGLTYRDYGGLLSQTGFDGTGYRSNVPAPLGLAANADLAYDTAIDPLKRADEFARDMQRYVDAGQMPSFAYVRLAGLTGSSPAADDRALGRIVQYLSTTQAWSATAVFIVPEGVDGADRVNPLRSYCLVVSPSAKRAYVGHANLSVASVLKTEEELLGINPLGLNDLLATDMADFFAAAPDPQPYTAIP